MSKLDWLLKGYKSFYYEHSRENQVSFRSLALKGQAPKAIVIACSDSRADPTFITKAQPGDIFVIRNVANIIPPYKPGNSSYHGTSAALEFGVNFLQIKDIIVMGHSKCSGVSAILNHNKDEPDSFISSWLKIAEPAKNIYNKNKKNLTKSEQEVIRISLKNLMSFPWIAEKVNNGEIELHGWYFSIFSTSLKILNKNNNKFEVFECP